MNWVSEVMVEIPCETAAMNLYGQHYWFYYNTSFLVYETDSLILCFDIKIGQASSAVD